MTAPHRPRKLPRLPAPLDPSEWDFDKVDDDQIEGCFWWEYCRESEEISAEIAKLGRVFREIDDNSADNFEDERALRASDSIHLLGRDVLRDFVWLQELGHFPGPWLKLKPRIQAIIAGEKVYTGEGKDRVLKETSLGVIRSMMPGAADIVADELVMRKEGLESKVSPAKDDYITFTLPKYRTGQMRAGDWGRLRSLMITVDWLANDSEIVKVFAAWLKRNRPDNFPQHKHFPAVTVFGEVLRRKNGELVDYRVALRWLGVLRREKHIEETLPSGSKDAAFKKLYPGFVRGKQASEARSVISLLESLAQPRAKS